MITEVDYVELGLACFDACTALDRGLKGKPSESLGNSVQEAITQFTRCVGSVVVSSEHSTDDTRR